MFTDLAADPYQRRDLAGAGKQADVAVELDRRLRAWDVGAPRLAEA